MEIKRGYVKWTDKDGVFHKEPLYDHPELLAEATPEQQAIAAELKALINIAKEEQEELLLVIEEPKKKK